MKVQHLVYYYCCSTGQAKPPELVKVILVAQSTHQLRQPQLLVNMILIKQWTVLRPPPPAIILSRITLDPRQAARVESIFHTTDDHDHIVTIYCFCEIDAVAVLQSQSCETNASHEVLQMCAPLKIILMLQY